MATSWASRLVTANTRVGVDSRKRENSAVPRAVRRGDNLPVETITGLGCPPAGSWGDMMTGMHSRSSQSSTPRAVRSELALYIDMADEPWKYSDLEMIAWLDLDERLRKGVTREAVESYWQDRDVLQKAEQVRADRMYKAEKDALRKRFRPIAERVAVLGAKRWIDHDIKRIVKLFKGSVIKIQATVRGYQTRCKTQQLDCCMCLSHRISPLETAVGYMCRDCAAMGPYQDIVEDDPWNWHRC
jgi:hypothetical protein